MGFVGNYAPCGLSPQTDGMPVIHKQGKSSLICPVYTIIIHFKFNNLLENISGKRFCIFFRH